MPTYNPKEIEEDVIEFWNEKNLRRKALEANKDGEIFYFLDGPPYPTGSMHMGTAMGKIVKDYFLRFHRMLGYNVHAQPGYDTHGLPIEHQVEKEQGFENKQDIEDYGVENFIDRCKEYATKYIEDMNGDFKNMGVWMDWENPYLTLHDYYIEGAWETFKQAYKKDFLYKDRYPVHVCPRCETAVAYNEVEYTKLHDPEIYLAFKLEESDEELLGWTTTPWTVPANTGAMVDPTLEYALVEINGRKLWMAEDRVQPVMDDLGNEEYEIVKTCKGEELLGKEYSHPLEDKVPAQKEVQGKVVASERYVTTEEGTGIVHSAPAHGQEDYEVGQDQDLEMITIVDLKGNYSDGSGEYKGTHVREANNQVIEDLEEAGALLSKSQVHHEYPKCWRCDTPLVQNAVPQWFFGTTRFRQKLLDENSEVNWVPDWAGQKFDEWLRQLEDWPVSRQRYWGIPLPIWECQDCGETEVLGSKEELPEEVEELHRPYIDRVTLDCDECGGSMERVPEVLDVWFDSGVAPWASLKHPEVDFTFEEEGPADLEEEGFDQIRGWWNSQFITSIMTHDTKPFRNVVYHGKVKLEGKEMSKSKGIIVKPEEVIEKYGRDLLRYYILSKDISEDWSWEWDEVEETKDFMNLIANIFDFKEKYSEPEEEPDELKTEDEWILSRLNTTAEKVRTHSTEPNFQAFKALRELEEFINEDVSKTYIKMIRDRVKEDSKEGKAARYTLNKVTESLVRLLAPFTPYFAEHHYNGSKDSVHLESFPEPDQERLDQRLEDEMRVFNSIREATARLRQNKGVKLRYPVRKVLVSGGENVQKTVENLQKLLKDRLNAKKVVYKDVDMDTEVKLDYSEAGPKLGDKVGDVERSLRESDHDEIARKIEEQGSVELSGMDLDEDLLDVRKHLPENRDGEEFDEGAVFIEEGVTSDLENEALARELVRSIQQKRKDLGLNVEDRVDLTLEENMKEFEDMIKDRVNVSQIEYEDPPRTHEDEVEAFGKTSKYSFSEPVN